jgi:hypothetical protein
LEAKAENGNFMGKFEAGEESCGCREWQGIQRPERRAPG